MVYQNDIVEIYGFLMFPVSTLSWSNPLNIRLIMAGKNEVTLLKCDQLHPFALEMDHPIISGGNQTWHWAIPCFNGGFWLGKSSISGWWDFPAMFDYWRVSRGFWQMPGASAVAAVWTSLQWKRCCLAKWQAGQPGVQTWSWKNQRRCWKSTICRQKTIWVFHICVGLPWVNPVGDFFRWTSPSFFCRVKSMVQLQEDMGWTEAIRNW